MKIPEDVNKPTEGDVAHDAARITLAAFPGFGGFAAELYSMVLKKPIQKRLEKWMGAVSEGLKELENKVESFSISKLQEDEEFISILMTASQIAQRNHQKEKLTALKNIVLNTALKTDIEEDLKFSFLTMVDNITATEIKIIHFLNNPDKWFKKISGSITSNYNEREIMVIELEFPDYIKNQRKYKHFAKKLHSMGLLDIDNLKIRYSDNGEPIKETTELGDTFLKFITDPIEKE